MRLLIGLEGKDVNDVRGVCVRSHPPSPSPPSPAVPPSVMRLCSIKGGFWRVLVPEATSLSMPLLQHQEGGGGGMTTPTTAVGVRTESCLFSEKG